MQKWRQSEAAKRGEWQLALEREAVIRPLAGEGKLTITLIEEATRQLQLSRSMCHAALKFRNHACLFFNFFRDLAALSLH
jgi:hypothetical protein